MIRAQAEVRPDALALLAPGEAPLRYGELRDRVERSAAALRALGVRTEDRVAIVLPNGLRMAEAFLSVASCAAAAPLNPAYTKQDFVFYLRDLGAKILLAGEGTPAAAREAAAECGVEVVERLVGGAAMRNWPDAAATALLLHTSGTPSRPKLVPLTHANLLASARNIARSLELAAEDRCLNIMPLFHIHGLAAALLASLMAGASVVCSDGVFAKSFFVWLAEFQPTWYSAVPTMHQGIVALAASQREGIARAKLRLIRSSSAALPPAVMADLERTFQVPVLEAYGMTEAAHQMASNPLPPRERKPGSVGLPAGPEIAVMAGDGRLMAAGEIGEVVIRGENVTPGYVANDEANRAAFAHGWFHTGDQGWLDDDGYLHLSGRLKELINRGGEKIAPREIDEAMLAHPAVKQALAFAVPHRQLGEDVGVAMELHSPAAAGEVELRDWAAGRLADFKVPRVIRIVEKIPLGPTGKPQRIGLAAKLGVEEIDDRALGEYLAPRNRREEAIAAIWREFLPEARVGVRDRFEALGGDSLLAVGMLAEVEKRLGVAVAWQRFVVEGTIESLARELPAERPSTALEELRPGTSVPLVCIPGHDGTLLGLARMAQECSAGMRVWAFNFQRLPAADSVAEMARACVAELRAVQPQGPYRLLGVCFGGCVALEMARQLEAAGQRVAKLALVDTLNPAWQRAAGPFARNVARAKQWGWKLGAHQIALQQRNWPGKFSYLAGRVGAFWKNHGEWTAARLGMDRVAGVKNRRLLLEHQPAPWRGDLLLVRVRGRRLEAPELGWRALVDGELQLVDLPFAAEGALAGDNARRLAHLLEERWGSGEE